jgi:hypothetical protein
MIIGLIENVYVMKALHVTSISSEWLKDDNLNCLHTLATKYILKVWNYWKVAEKLLLIFIFLATVFLQKNVKNLGLGINMTYQLCL